MIYYSLNQVKTRNECFDFLEAMSKKHGKNCAGWHGLERLEVIHEDNCWIRNIYIVPARAVDEIMIYTALRETCSHDIL